VRYRDFEIEKPKMSGLYAKRKRVSKGVSDCGMKYEQYNHFGMWIKNI
jgi:hypothetical protein